MVMMPCLVCKNRTQGKLSKHHLVPRQILKDKGIQVNEYHNLHPVKTIRLCRDTEGCQSHHLFHLGDKRVAQKIREELSQTDIQWMVLVMGSKWVRETYPPR